MTRRKAPVADKLSLEAILRGVDPIHAAVMTMGGIAAASGLKPPLTMLLSALNSEAAGDIWHNISTPGYQLISEWLSGTNTTDPTFKSKQQEAIAYFCAGAMEAAIMYQLVSNPETFKEIMKLPGQVMSTVGKIIP